MRTQPGQKELKDWLIEIGEGRMKGTEMRGENGNFTTIPDELVSENLQDVMNFCFLPAMFLTNVKGPNCQNLAPNEFKEGFYSSTMIG